MKEEQQHFEHYKEMGKIDYCTYFIKNYLALNFYCKTRFETRNKKKDREIIDALKDDKQVLHRFSERLDENPKDEKLKFFGLLKDFDKILEKSGVKHNTQLVSFTSVQVQPMQLEQWSEKNRKVTYVLKIHSDRVWDNMLNISVEVRKSKPCSIKGIFDIESDKFISALREKRLSDTQIKTIQDLFRKRLKGRVENIAKLIHRSDKNMLEGDDRGLIYRGLMEILYQLRNALLHSDVQLWVPRIQEVYKQATLILQEVLEFLPF
ncbi:hypothetical protein NHP190003_09620 [Helicobacter sp. NHP19-003]|uniref:Apea-like HEPN domain-containing protein n=1 Tax=Helicobacter gastrocanis TaxID=2849641 RepID=A0ABN6I834_9HELI|nr:hypothetical protein [Helicobacter sp. NHP19-003]BCZ17680.1 hypothetical protein NHP190003_09620 [Helicobacter sp. NHP19-003]